MSLSDRLANAARERAGATGTSVEGSRRKHQPASPTQEGKAGAAWITVVIRPHIPVAAIEPDPAAEPASVCPTCGRVGELGVLDIHRRNADWSCTACGTMWRVSLPAAPPFDQPPAH